MERWALREASCAGTGIGPTHALRDMRRRYVVNTRTANSPGIPAERVLVPDSAALWQSPWDPGRHLRWGFEKESLPLPRSFGLENSCPNGTYILPRGCNSDSSASPPSNMGLGIKNIQAISGAPLSHRRRSLRLRRCLNERAMVILTPVCGRSSAVGWEAVFDRRIIGTRS